MRLYIHNNKKRFWKALFLFCLVTTFLLPCVHSQNVGHDGGILPHANALNVAATHNHAERHAGEWFSDNLFAPGTDFTVFSGHDHNTDQHSHFIKNLLIRVKRVARGLEEQKPFILQTVSIGLDFSNAPCKISNQLTAPITTPSNLEYIFIATDLPPPIA